MKLGSLFSGAGLGDLGWMMSGMDIRWQCEIDKYCQKILDLRFPETKKYTDIRGLINEELEPVDIVAGGFPCQDLSQAGLKKGIEGERSGLWKEMLRVVCKVRPKYVVVENVAGLLHRGIDVVLRDLSIAGYDAEWFTLSASDLGQYHERKRIWIVSYPNGSRSQGMFQDLENLIATDEQSPGKVATYSFGEEFYQGRYWPGEARIWGVANSIPNRIYRLKCIGNCQVPIVTRWIAERILACENEKTTQ